MSRNFILEIIVFVTGAVVMILELTGTRIMAPYAGTSIIVWTSLIGVILGFLSAGYSYGGKLADKRANYRNLGNILLISAVLVASINIFRPLVLILSESLFTDVRLGSVFFAILLFGPASFTLGIVPTYSVRLKIKNLKNSGETVGKLYALSTLGSIFGTFLGGFILIAVLGNRNIIFLLSLILAFISFISYSQIFKKGSILLIYFAILVLSFKSSDFFWYKGKKVILDTDSQYSRIIVAQIREPVTEKLLIVLFTGRFFYPYGGYQSAVYLDEEDRLPAGYLNFFKLGEYFNDDIKKALLIGGGVFTFPKDFIKRNPESQMDVVELDPKLTDISEKYFKIDTDSRIQIVNTDGRTFLRNNENKYDAIYMDAYSDFSFPWHLITSEASEQIYNSLEADGIFIINVISSIEGVSGKTFRSIYRTLKESFTEVYVFPVSYQDNGYAVQNIVLIALKENNESLMSDLKYNYPEYSSHLWKKSVELDTPVNSDDFAPLEYYYYLMSQVVLKVGKKS